MLGCAFLEQSLGWLQHRTVVQRRQFASSEACLSVAGSQEERMGSRRGRELRGAGARKMWLAAEQLASAARSDRLAQEGPNYSTTAVSIIAVAGAARAVKHWKGPACGCGRLLELLCSLLAIELHKTYQMSGRKIWVIFSASLCNNVTRCFYEQRDCLARLGYTLLRVFLGKENPLGH